MTTTPTPASSPSTSGTAEVPAPPTFVSAAPARTLSVLSLVAAIASVPLGHVIVLPIAAIILGFLARSREPWGRDLSTWGIAVGFVVLFFWVVVAGIAAAVWLPFALLHHTFG